MAEEECLLATIGLLYPQIVVVVSTRIAQGQANQHFIIEREGSQGVLPLGKELQWEKESIFLSLVRGSLPILQ